MYSVWKKDNVQRHIFLLVGCIIMTKNSAMGVDINLALRKPAVQSSVYLNYDASKGVDGKTNTGVGHGECAHTAKNADPAWWIVDLLRSYEIHTIKIRGRYSNAYRFREFSVHLSEYNPLKNLDFPNGYKGNLCFFYADTIPDGGAAHTINCTHPVVGRYLTLYKAANEWLVLCELQAIGSVRPKLQHCFPFHAIPNYRSPKVPFYHRDGVANALNCAVVCLNAPGGITTMSNYQVITGQCQCIELSQLTNKVEKEHANDTELYVSEYN